mmetsp:Transcript_50520/g.120094  ORF Transcript_50520/g.120094 Transcript_50520/m.120094 type:complete len:324 (-) Transcript_50520:65-1036(-)
MDEAEQMEIIATMANHLDMIAEAMKEPPEGDDQKMLVQELLSDCNETRAKLESLAVQVIEQENREDTFNRITQELDRHDRLQEKFRAWSSMAPGGGVPPSPAMSGMAPMTDGSVHGFDGEGMSSAPSYADDAARRKKEKKEKKRAKANSDFGAADGGFAGWPAGDADAGAPQWGSAPAHGSEGGGWPAQAEGGSPGGFEAAPWGGAEGFGAGGFPDAPASAFAPPPASDVGWGDVPPPPGHSQATFGDEPHRMASAPHSPGLSHHSHHTAHGASGVHSSIVFHQPYSEIAHDVDHFKMQFIRATAESLGIPPHRIRVKGVRPQ